MTTTPTPSRSAEGRLKVMTVLGTRPEIIRLSEVIRVLDRHCRHVLVHTGQNYDHELNQVFFDDLGLRAPDHVLDVKSATIGEQMGKILQQTEAVMLRERPDALLILGDTNSALSCIVAKRLRIPTFHMEAGNRCFDDRVPEEINRRIVDHTADVNFPYTLHAKTNLLREGLSPDRIVVTGSPMREVLEKHMDRIRASDAVARLGLEPGRYFVVSAHREENVDSDRILDQFIDTLETLHDAYKAKVLVSTHPRTRKRLEARGAKLSEGVILHKPLGFFDYVNLQLHALCNLSDSGTIHEDAGILDIPAVVIREVTERPEAIDNANVVLCGMRGDDVLRAVELVLEQRARGVRFTPPPDYMERNVADKVARHVLGQARLVKAKVWR